MLDTRGKTWSWCPPNFWIFFLWVVKYRLISHSLNRSFGQKDVFFFIYRNLDLQKSYMCVPNKLIFKILGHNSICCSLFRKTT